jgi:hypothetical protein
MRWQSLYLGVGLCGALAIAAVRQKAFDHHKRIRERDDVYFLPPPATVKVLTFGYEDTVADLLWAHVRVAQGLRLRQMRRFDSLLDFYDLINHLAPKWRSPYLYVDALITIQPGGEPSLREIKKVREVLERGVKHRPFDAELWLNLGQFLAFIAPPSYLDKLPELARKWELDGTRYLAKAAVLGAGDSRIGWQALGGANRLVRAGKLKASIRFLRRTYAATDDPSLRERIEQKLRRLLGKEASERQLNIFHRFNRVMKAELPWIGRAQALTLGPPPWPSYCSGSAHQHEAKCATNWNEWTKRSPVEPLPAKTAK